MVESTHLSTELEENGSAHLCSFQRDLLTDLLGSNLREEGGERVRIARDQSNTHKSDMLDCGVASESFNSVRQASDDLNEVGRLSTCLETAPDGANVVMR